MEWSYYLKLLGLSVGVVVVRLMLGMGMFRGPDVEYVFDATKSGWKRLSVLLLLIAVVFVVLVALMAWYRAEGNQ